MTRDLELIRLLLLKGEQKETKEGWIIPSIEGYSEKQVAYHISLMMDAGLIEGIDLSTKNGFEYGLKSLTWFGHDFLDVSRDQGIWDKAKKKIGSKFSTLTLDVIKGVLVNLIKEELQ